jgi:hypothetical protein
MKMNKFPLLALAIILAAGGALANSFSKNQAREVTQYYKVGTAYYPAGIEGYDYLCEFDHFGTCTYYLDEASGTYKPSKGGKIVFYR